MGCYIGSTGYYEGDRIGDDEEVEQRPSPLHVRQGGEWVLGPAPVPQEVSMRQGREALLRRGYFETVDSYIQGLTGTAGKIARNEWEKSQVIQRNRPLTLAMGQLLGLDMAGLDELFVYASTL